jgi:hypothetical protein
MLALNLAMSFSILALYVSDIDVIILVVLLLTTSIVAASTNDLTILRQERTLIVIMIGFAIFVYVASTLLFSYIGTEIFYSLIAINVGLLLAYVVMRRTDRPTSLSRQLGRR